MKLLLNYSNIIVQNVAVVVHFPCILFLQKISWMDMSKISLFPFLLIELDMDKHLNY